MRRRNHENASTFVSVLAKKAITRPTISPTTPKKISDRAISESSVSAILMKAMNESMSFGEKIKKMIAEPSPITT